jgi:hypothetical protein
LYIELEKCYLELEFNFGDDREKLGSRLMSDIKEKIIDLK